MAMARRMCKLRTRFIRVTMATTMAQVCRACLSLLLPITLAVMVLTGQVSSQTSFNWLDGSGWPPYSEYTAKHSSLFMAGPG